MNCLKNSHCKSNTEFYNTSPQALTSSLTPLNLLGVEVTDTGIAIDVKGNTAELNYSGIYRISNTVIVDATTGGDVTIELTENGSVLPETVRTITVPAGNTAISIDTVRYFSAGCMKQAQIQLVAGTDGTAVGNAALVEGSIEKIS